MRTNYLSAPVTGLDASLVTRAAWDSRSPAISQKETKRTKIRGVDFAFLLAAFLGSCVTSEVHAQVVVVPNSLATNDGNGTATSPEGLASARWLHIHDASQFGALSGPSFLTKFAYRPDRVLGQSGPRSLTLRIYASTTSRTVAGISTTFAANLGTNNTLVFDGTVNVTTGNLPGPGNTRQFDYVFPFTTPFLYDPAAGNLVLSLQIEANGSALTFDTVSGDSAIGRVGIGSSTATTGNMQASHVTQLTFEPPPKVTVRLGQAVYWTTEGNDTVWLTVERGNDVAQEPFTVQYATSDLTAKAGLDYETAAGVLSFAAGETNKTLAIKILNDELQENEETFRVTLSNLTGWALMGTPATATVKILQDTVLRALSSGANLTHTRERESVTFSFTSQTGPISVLGDLPELGNNNPNNAVRLVLGADSVWRATVSLPADRAYTYRFYRGITPVSDPITAQTRSVSRQPAAKTVYYHSSLGNPVLNWRQSSNGVFTATSMLRIGPGREVGEGLWLAAGVGESGREIEFFIAEPAAAGRDPALGNHWTCLDVAFLQDGHLFNYVPAARVSPHRRDYDPDAPPSIRSEILNANRQYRVMLPRGYAEHPRRRYPVIYFHDGGAQWEIFPGGIGRTVVDPEGDIMAGLIRQGIMGEVIAVGIDIDTAAPDLSDARFRDYIPPGDQPSGIQGAADKYVQYIIQELKPLIDARYRTRSGPESTFTAGQSRGANVALYMVWDFPHVFTRAGTHSGTFEHAPNFMARVKQEPKRDIRIYLDSGEDSVSGVLALRDNLVAKSLPFVVEGGLRHVYARGQQHLTEDFASRRPMMLSFLYPVTEEANELIPRLEIVAQNGIRLRVAGPAGLPGRLQRSTDLREWSDWQSISFGSEPVEISDPQTVTATQQFYRVIAP